MPVILATWEAEIWRISIWGQPFEENSLRDPVSKITRAKETGGVAHVVEHLLCKHEVLSSNPTKNQNKHYKGMTSQSAVLFYDSTDWE
jgi:hypothetical protein